MKEEFEIEKVAKVANLKLSDEEIEEFTLQLKEVINAFNVLKNADVKNVEPSLQPIEIKDVVRADKIEKSLRQEEALSNTKNKKNGFFIGPEAIV